MKRPLRHSKKRQDGGIGIGRLHVTYGLGCGEDVPSTNAKQKFQDLEEERLDFMKSSLWTFANVASTVCVSDDAVSLRLWTQHSD